MVPPEAVPGLLKQLRKRFVDLAQEDFSDSRRNSLVFGGLFLWALYAAYRNQVAFHESQNLGLAGLLLLMMGLLPLYEAWKSRRSGRALNAENLREEEREARFEEWMDQQPMRVTFLLLALILVVGVAQVWLGDLQTSVEAAGLLKTDGQPLWRFLTSPFLHGNFLHGGLNAAGLWYLGRRTESLMGWPHLLLGFFIAMVAGGVATDYFVPDRPSIGASGGVLGVLGMLLGFELLHQKLVPKSARRRLAAGVLATFAIGLVGYSFIDNAAHAGGLIAGLVYALLVFSVSKSARRPKANRLDRVVGIMAAVALTGSALWAFWMMVAS